MRVRCSQCGAAGKVHSTDSTKLFKCPRCGGAMKAVNDAPEQPTGTARSATAFLEKRLNKLRRHRRRRLPVILVAVGVAVTLLGVFAAYMATSLRKEAGPGAKTLELLPASALFAASVEKFQTLETELAAFSGTNPFKLKEAIQAGRRRLETFIADGLGVSGDDAASVAGAIVGLGFGAVPVKDKEPAAVLLLALKPSRPFGELLSKAVPLAGDVAGVSIRKGRIFATLLEEVNTAILCEQREPIEEMIQAFKRRPISGCLAAVKDFLDARAANCNKGRAWFYVSPEVAGAARDIAKAAAPAIDVPVSTDALPPFKYVAGHVALANPRLAVRASVELPDDRKNYDDLTIPPMALTILNVVPADSDVAVALSLGEPSVTYDHLLRAFDTGGRAGGGIPLRTIVRDFESNMRISLAREVIPLLKGEVGLFVSMRPEAAGGALLIPVREPRDAETVLLRLLTKLSGSEPKATTQNGLKTWTLAGMLGVSCAFVQDVLVVGTGPNMIQAVVKAKSSGASLATDPQFRQAAGADLPRQSTLLVARRQRDPDGTSLTVVSVTTEKNRVSIAASVPSLAQALVANAGMLGSGTPVPSVDDSPAGIERRSRANITELADLVKQYLARDGQGVLYPSSFADLLKRNYITRKNDSLLVRPGDKNPVLTPGMGMPPTSYQMAFDAVKTHQFTADTPGKLPMVWEIGAAHDDKRLVVSFDGTVTLEATSVADIIKRLQNGLPRKVEPPEPQEKKKTDGARPSEKKPDGVP